MKSLLALLLLGIALGIGYWKTQFPDATIDDLSGSASSGINRLKGSVASLTGGGAAQEALAGRLDSIEAELVETQKAADPSAINGRLDSIEAELVETQRATDPSVINGRLTDAERRMDASEARLSKLDQTIGDNNNLISSLTSGPDAVAANLSALDNKLDLLNRRIDEQSQEFNADSINRSLSELNTSLSQLQDEQRIARDEQNATLTGMDEKLSAFESRLNTLSSGAANGQAEAVASVNAEIDQRHNQFRFLEN